MTQKRVTNAKHKQNTHRYQIPSPSSSDRWWISLNIMPQCQIPKYTKQTHARTHAHTHPLNGPLSGTTQVSRYQKGKPICILLKQETVSGSGISCTICKSASRSRQITTPAPHHSVFTGRMPFLSPNQQCQSTEGKKTNTYIDIKCLTKTVHKTHNMKSKSNQHINL